MARCRGCHALQHSWGNERAAPHPPGTACTCQSAPCTRQTSRSRRHPRAGRPCRGGRRRRCRWPPPAPGRAAGPAERRSWLSDRVWEHGGGRPRLRRALLGERGRAVHAVGLGWSRGLLISALMHQECGGERLRPRNAPPCPSAAWAASTGIAGLQRLPCTAGDLTALSNPAACPASPPESLCCLGFWLLTPPGRESRTAAAWQLVARKSHRARPIGAPQTLWSTGAFTAATAAAAIHPQPPTKPSWRLRALRGTPMASCSWF